jgi:hypothetical protein
MPPGVSPRGLALLLGVVFLLPLGVAGVALGAAQARQAAGQGPGTPGVLRDVRVERRFTPREGAVEKWQATLRYRDGAVDRQVDLELPAEVARGLPLEKPTTFWTYRDVLHQLDVYVPQEALSAAQALAASALRGASLFLLLSLGVAAVGLRVVRSLWRRATLLQRGEVALGRVLGAGWKAGPRGRKWVEVAFEVTLAGRAVKGAEKVSRAQLKQLGRLPQDGDTAFIVHDPADPTRLELWGIGAAPV